MVCYNIRIIYKLLITYTYNIEFLLSTPAYIVVSREQITHAFTIIVYMQDT